MKLEPDNLACDVCGQPATVQLRDTSSNAQFLYCKDHRPELSPGRRQSLAIERHRLPPGNPLSRMLAAAEDSPEHQSFRAEMCEVRLLGGDGACRYYLSMLTDADQFAMWNDEFEENMRVYVVRQTKGAATAFPFDSYSVGFMAPLLKAEFERTPSDSEPKLTRTERAVVLLLRHPQWSDEQIAESVPTTTGQLSRNSDYNVLRTLMARKNAAAT